MSSTIKSRLHRSKGRNSRITPKSVKPVRRNRFNAVIRECCGLLDSLGVPWVQSYGEAEAMCAYLEITQLVDGCITNDGDVLLYGASNVYRNFSMKEDEQHCVKISLYRMWQIEEILNLDQMKLICLALVMGCDYTSGIKGIGKSSITTFLKSFNMTQYKHGETVLERFHSWKRLDYHAVDKLDAQIRKKCLVNPGFPNNEIIKEYHIPKDSIKSKIIWRQPSFFKFNDFTFKMMDWVDEYSERKITHYISRFNLLNPLLGDTTFTLDKIVKKRIVRGVDSLELQWKLKGYNGSRPLTSVEPEHLLKTKYQQEIDDYYQAILDKKEKIENTKKMKKNQRKKNVNAKTKNSEEENEKATTDSSPAPSSPLHNDNLLPDDSSISFDDSSATSDDSSANSDDSSANFDDPSANSDDSSASSADSCSSFNPDLYGDMVTDLIEHVDSIKLHDNHKDRTDDSPCQSSPDNSADDSSCQRSPADLATRIKRLKRHRLQLKNKRDDEIKRGNIHEHPGPNVEIIVDKININNSAKIHFDHSDHSSIHSDRSSIHYDRSSIHSDHSSLHSDHSSLHSEHSSIRSNHSSIHSDHSSDNLQLDSSTYSEHYSIVSSPHNSTIKSVQNSPSKSPLRYPSKSPLNSSCKSPLNSSSKSPPNSSLNSPLKSPLNSLLKSPLNSPAKDSPQNSSNNSSPNLESTEVGLAESPPHNSCVNNLDDNLLSNSMIDLLSDSFSNSTFNTPNNNLTKFLFASSINSKPTLPKSQLVKSPQPQSSIRDPSYLFSTAKSPSMPMQKSPVKPSSDSPPNSPSYSALDESSIYLETTFNIADLSVASSLNDSDDEIYTPLSQRMAKL